MNHLRSVLTALICITPALVTAEEQGTPIQAVLNLTSFGGGTEAAHGNTYMIRHMIVQGTLSGDIVGEDTHDYDLNLNLKTGVGITFGTISMVVTSPCVGTFEGVFHGKNWTGDFVDQDSGSATLHGAGGCEGLLLEVDYTEPQDAVFLIQGLLK